VSAAGTLGAPGPIELVADARAELGEGPVWDAHRGQLLWLGLSGGVLHFYDPGTGADRGVNLGRMLGSLVPDGLGGVIVAAAGGLFQLGDDGRLRQLLALEESLPGGVPNDSCCDPAGNLWVGITTVGEVAGAGSLYRVTPDLTATKVLSGLTVPNGIDWSPDGRTAYFADSPAYRIDAFQFDPASQSLGERSTFASFQPCGGAPDGLTVDAEGYVWVALWGVWSVRRYRPDGQLDLVVEVPVERVSSYGFGGAGLRNLYVTTASPGADADSRQAQPAAGGLFRYLAPAAGRPVRPFRLAEQGPPPANTGAPPRP